MSNDTTREELEAKLLPIARAVWPVSSINVMDGSVTVYARVEGQVVPGKWPVISIIHPRAAEALHAALRVLADEPAPSPHGVPVEVLKALATQWRESKRTETVNEAHKAFGNGVTVGPEHCAQELESLIVQHEVK